MSTVGCFDDFYKWLPEYYTKKNELNENIYKITHLKNGVAIYVFNIYTGIIAKYTEIGKYPNTRHYIRSVIV